MSVMSEHFTKFCVANLCLFFRPDMDKILVPKLKDIIKRHQGHLVDNIDDATHIIHPPTATNDDGRFMLHHLTYLPIHFV